MWVCIAIFASASVAAALLRWQALRHGRERARAGQDHRLDLEGQREEIRLQFQSRQQALFNGMSEGVLLLDPHGRVQMTNESLSRTGRACRAPAARKKHC
jgi:PAS domain-containing protein